MKTLSRCDESPPTQHVGLDVGSDPTVLGQTDEPIHKQCIPNPVWNGLVVDTGVAG